MVCSYCNHLKKEHNKTKEDDVTTITACMLPKCDCLEYEYD